MSTNLTPLLAAYVDSMNANDSTAFVANFAADAVVHDEGHEHRGTAAIKAWFENAHRKYQPKMEVTGATESGSDAVIAALVSGTFDGSPVELRHHLTIIDGKITNLAITA